MKTKNETFLFIARKLNNVKDFSDKEILNAYEKEWDISKASLLAPNLNYFYFDFYLFADNSVTLNPAVAGLQSLLKKLYCNNIKITSKWDMMTLNCVERFLCKDVGIDMEDIYWFNYFYREYCYTFDLRMSRVYRLERFIYEDTYTDMVLEEIRNRKPTKKDLEKEREFQRKVNYISPEDLFKPII